MHILMLVQSPIVHGPVTKHTPLLITSLKDLGCDIQTSLWGRHSDKETLSDKLFGRMDDLFQVREKLKSRKFDMVIVKTAHDWATLSRDLPLLLVTRHLCPHIVLQFHGSSSEKLVAPGNFLFKFFSRWLVSLCAAALVLSTEEQREWTQFYPNGRFDVVSNPFTPEAFDDSNIDQGIKDVKMEPLILFVGRLIREKGVFDLLDAISLLRKKSPCRLLVVGDGPGAGAVKEKVVHLGLADCVTMTGYLKGKELSAAYRKSDILVLPTYWIEGFPTVIAEAMSYGLPIVTTRTRGAADHLQEMVNALFVQPRASTALANVILTLLDDPDLRARMGRANREKIKDFSPDVVAKHYLNALKKIVNA